MDGNDEESALDEEMKEEQEEEEGNTMSEEDDEEELEESVGVKSLEKQKRNEEEEQEEDIKEETADEEEDDAEDEEEDEDEDEEDKERRKNDLDADEEEEETIPSKIELSDPASMLYMVRSLTDEEARRHEQYRRSYLDRGAIKRIMAKVIHDCTPMDRKMPAITQVMMIVMAGMTKVFVGEITAEARRLMEKNGETGPIEPRHLREVHRKYYKRRPLARGRNLRRLLR